MKTFIFRFTAENGESFNKEFQGEDYYSVSETAYQWGLDNQATLESIVVTQDNIDCWKR